MINFKDIQPLIEEAFDKNKTFLFPVQGKSMQPLFHANDLVELAPIEQVKKMDIVLYQRTSGQYVLHRLHKIKNGVCTFAGDHQFAYEKGIKLEQCIGKVISYKKTGKEKQYSLKGLKYHIYCFFIRFKLIRGFFAKIL